MKVFELEIHELPILIDYLVPLLDQCPFMALDGELAAGKTTLTRLICERLGVTDEVASPTYAILNTYQAQDRLVYHMDLYRIETDRELIDLGLEELFEQNRSIFIIEWPDIALHLLPRPAIWIKIEKTDMALRKFSVIIN